jgi:hypothetical protein
MSCCFAGPQTHREQEAIVAPSGDEQVKNSRKDRSRSDLCIAQKLC